jgi:hypothetical protein
MDLESLLVSLRDRHNRLREGSMEKMSFLLHLKSLSRWNEEPLDYPNIRNTEFPTSIQIALGVCTLNVELVSILSMVAPRGANTVAD